eukprot:222601-Chlamydomonas_euryale.AAC.1
MPGGFLPPVEPGKQPASSNHLHDGAADALAVAALSHVPAGQPGMAERLRMGRKEARGMPLNNRGRPLSARGTLEHSSLPTPRPNAPLCFPQGLMRPSACPKA